MGEASGEVKLVFKGAARLKNQTIRNYFLM